MIQISLNLFDEIMEKLENKLQLTYIKDEIFCLIELMDRMFDGSCIFNKKRNSLVVNISPNTFLKALKNIE